MIKRKREKKNDRDIVKILFNERNCCMPSVFKNKHIFFHCFYSIAKKSACGCKIYQILSLSVWTAQVDITIKKKMTELSRILHHPENQHSLLSSAGQRQVENEILDLLNNQETQIGRQGARVIHQKHLRHKSIFVLSSFKKVSPEMYSEISNYLGNGFSLNVGQLTLPNITGSSGMGKQMYTYIEYTESKSTITLALLWTLFVVGLYITPLISYMGGKVGVLQTRGWTKTIIENAIATSVMYAFIQAIKTTPKLKLFYDIYFMDMKTTSHILIGLAGCLVYFISMFVIHTRQDTSMFGALYRLMA